MTVSRCIEFVGEHASVRDRLQTKTAIATSIPALEWGTELLTRPLVGRHQYEAHSVLSPWTGTRAGQGQGREVVPNPGRCNGHLHFRSGVRVLNGVYLLPRTEREKVPLNLFTSCPHRRSPGRGSELPPWEVAHGHNGQASNRGLKIWAALHPGSGQRRNPPACR